MLVLILALSAVATTVSANPSGTVTCTDTQYTPVITYTSNAGVITDLKLYIGADTDNGGDATCTKTESTVAASTLKTFTYTVRNERESNSLIGYHILSVKGIFKSEIFK